ncbi:MAG: ATP-dependent nuclease, subunit [Myxococcaceae bacterium]|nr:ATP-dependent nuclease, subunit [Myxococcaceae bacterium]
MSGALHTLCISPSAEQRLVFAADFLRQLPARGPALLLVPGATAATLLLTRVLQPGEARFSWHKRTLDNLARELALPELAREGRVPLSHLAVEALVTRVVHELANEGRLGRYHELAERPGFVRALARTLDELRHADIEPARLHPHAPELAAVLARYRDALQQLALADRAHVFAAAQRRVESDDDASQHVPLLALDVPLVHQCEAELARVLCERRPLCCITAARGDERSEVHWRAALGQDVEVSRLEPSDDDELQRLQAQLFAPSSARVRSMPREPAAVQIVSSPGEAREAVEVARGLVEAAARGVPFDRMAIVLRAVEGYRGVVEEALTRAEIPAHFADGVRRPLPEGRAFLALLACARDGLSARAFAEYLSLSAMPRGAGDEAFATPRQWERMLVEAAVVGGRERWTRRITGLLRELSDEQSSLDDDDPRRALLARDCKLLSSLEHFATPLLDALVALPEGGTWSAWLAALMQLAKLSLQTPDSVIDLLRELSPLAPVGPVSLRSVHRILSQRLSSVVQPSRGHGAGSVFVGAIEDVRGRAFDVVFVTGLAERVFPARIAEDALLPDDIRRQLGAELWLTEERVARERLLLRLAVGCARVRLVLSFPRFDVAHGRPRVPSFYGLEVLQAIDGTLPAFDELTRRALPGAAARMGFPAPERAEQAIDDAEYDLAMLDRLMRAPVDQQRGAARYLLEENPHLARALRFRARRWELAKFSPADGFVAIDAVGKSLLDRERLSARVYSATALSHFAACPYRFFLHAIMGVAERPEALPVDELDARQRGVLSHRVQRAVLSELASAGLLPLTAGSLPQAQQLLGRVFEGLAARARDDYAPSIDGVFETGLLAIERDLREWLERETSEKLFVPTHYELAFGMRTQGENDAGSFAEPVQLSVGLRLCGSIDLVERSLGREPEATPVLRATDYKTSAAKAKLDITSGGRVLQPLLYALALESLFPGAKVASGRLYFCSARGEFQTHEVALDARARDVAKQLVRSIDAMLEQGFLPAAPAQQPQDRERSECERCAYRVVCGPYEAERVGQVKSRDLARLAPLHQLRNLP